MPASIKKRFLITAVCVLAFAYVASFCVLFRLTDLPTRNIQAGWLGPTPRDGRHIECMGDFNEDASGKMMRYKIYQPLCKLWLLVDGIAG